MSRPALVAGCDALFSIKDNAMNTLLSQIAEVRPGFPFRSSIIEDVAGDALVVQLKDVSRESGPDWTTLTRTRLSGRRPFPFLQDVKR